MSKAKRGLGKGLGALIDTNIEEAQPNVGGVEIDVNLIDANKEQPRKQFDEEPLNELAESIKIHGIIQPLIVKEQNGRYLIIAGERRYRAARMAGLKKVPVVLKDADEKTLLQMSIVENLQREDLNPIEEAEAMALLMNRFAMTQEQVAEVVGRSRSAVANTLRLLALPEEIRRCVQEGALSAGHARALSAIKDEKLLLFAAVFVKDNELSVRQTEEYVKKLLGDRKKSKSVQNKAPEFAEAERVLTEKLDTKVKITGNQNKGTISLAYFSKEQLYALYDLLTLLK